MHTLYNVSRSNLLQLKSKKKREITKEKYLSIKFIKIFSLKNTKYFYLTRIKNYYFDITGNLMLRRMKMQMYLI